VHSIRLSKICTGDPLPLCRRRKYQQASKLDSEKKRLNFACYCLIFLTPDPNRYDTQGLFTPRLYARTARDRLNFNFLKKNYEEGLLPPQTKKQDQKPRFDLNSLLPCLIWFQNTETKLETSQPLYTTRKSRLQALLSRAPRLTRRLT
jgi:hypothetical protein